METESLVAQETHLVPGAVLPADAFGNPLSLAGTLKPYVKCLVHRLNPLGNGFDIRIFVDGEHFHSKYYEFDNNAVNSTFALAVAAKGMVEDRVWTVCQATTVGYAPGVHFQFLDGASEGTNRGPGKTADYGYKGFAMTLDNMELAETVARALAQIKANRQAEVESEPGQIVSLDYDRYDDEGTHQIWRGRADGYRVRVRLPKDVDAESVTVKVIVK